MVLTRLEDLVNEFGDHVRDEGWISVGEERYRRHKRPAIEIDDVLKTDKTNILMLFHQYFLQVRNDFDS